MLRELDIKSVYRSESDNILKDFYIPALSVSIKYDRAVGFFSANMLSYAAQGLSAFVKNDGKMRLIFGGALEPEDERAIKEGYDLRQLIEKFGNYFIETVETIKDDLFYRRVEALSWMVASGHLDIKIAFRKQGMYHEKIGILTDNDGDRIVFQGAANETANALLPDFNFESINVFECWRSEFENHFMPYIIGFEKLWNNESPNTLVLEFPEAARNKLIIIAKRIPRIMTKKIEETLWDKHLNYAEKSEDKEYEPKIPDIVNGEEFKIKIHQQKALNIWKSSDWRGILAHATGAGKTITSIYGAVRIYESFKRLFVIVAVPYQNLADQWIDAFRMFNVQAIRCYESTDKWFSRLSEYLTMYQTGSIKFICLVVVNRTLQSHSFQGLLKQIPGGQLLFIGDECHHHGSQSLAEALPQQAALRLGLSATPEHYINNEANNRLRSYYGDIVDTYSMQDALREEVLTPYKYHVILVELTEQEADEYRLLSDQISRLYASNTEESYFSPDNNILSNLLFRRSRILGNAENKLKELQLLLCDQKPRSLSLFYCGDGSVEDEESGEIMRQVDAVTRILYELGWKSSHFTARETRDVRIRLLNDFRLSNIHALVAIRCLDEGIDVPACERAYIMASSRNPRQFIQRRGRILRRSLGKEFAEIYDFIVTIPPEISKGSTCERNMIKAELQRVAEFTRLALNAGESVRTLLPVLRQYDLEYLLT